jgi:hypothetical protein
VRALRFPPDVQVRGIERAFIPTVFRQIIGCAWVSWILQVFVVPISHTGVAFLRHPKWERRHAALAIIGS